MTAETIPFAASAAASPAASGRTGGRGTAIVVGLLLLGVAAALTGIWFQWRQTRRCLDLYGPEAARRITTAPSVFLMRLAASPSAGRLAAIDPREISDAKGLVHVRRGLVEDANFAWERSTQAASRLPDGAWDYAISFADPAGQGSTSLVIDFDDQGGTLAVVGRPGRVGLGRIERGLRTWIKSLGPAQNEQK